MTLTKHPISIPVKGQASYTSDLRCSQPRGEGGGSSEGLDEMVGEDAAVLGVIYFLRVLIFS